MDDKQNVSNISTLLEPIGDYTYTHTWYWQPKSRTKHIDVVYYTDLGSRETNQFPWDRVGPRLNTWNFTKNIVKVNKIRTFILKNTIEVKKSKTKVKNK